MFRDYVSFGGGYIHGISCLVTRSLHRILLPDTACVKLTVLDESSPLKEPGKKKLVWNQLVKLGEAKKRLSFWPKDSLRVRKKRFTYIASKKAWQLCPRPIFWGMVSEWKRDPNSKVMWPTQQRGRGSIQVRDYLITHMTLKQIYWTLIHHITCRSLEQKLTWHQESSAKTSQLHQLHTLGPFNNKKSLLAHALITVLKMRGFPGATVMSSSAWRHRSLGKEKTMGFITFSGRPEKPPQCLKHSELSWNLKHQDFGKWLR